jgi:uncharacterized phiE125 gp8 family phage protein
MLTRFAAPAATPVSLTEAKAHLAVTHTSDDTLIQLYLDAAVAHLDGAEGVLGRCLVTQTWDYAFDRFDGTITVPLPTLQTVTSVTYVDTAGDTQTVNASDYTVAGQRIVPGDAGWPDTDDVPHAVTVRFVAGYGLAVAVPAAIKAAILLYVGDMYANREAGGGQLFENPAALRLLRPYMKVRV